MINIIVSVITGLCTIIATVITVKSGNTKLMQDIKIHSAVQDTKLENLTNEVRKHNNFAERIPKIEQQIEYIEKRLEL